MLEIRFHGRGGQGAVVAAEILANTLLHEGKDSQNFPDFGIERQGAPVMVFQRMDEKKILIRCKIYYPDFVVVLDYSLIKAVNAVQGLKQSGWLLINSLRDPSGFQELGPFNIATVDAKGIALKYKIGTATRPIVNTVILGAMAKILGISFESLTKAIEEIFEKKFGGKAVESNIKGAKEAYETVKILEVTSSEK